MTDRKASVMAELRALADLADVERSRSGRAKILPTREVPRGYNAVHQRLRRHRGPATEQRCTHCSATAHDWAYDHSDPSELSSEDGLVYSLDLDRYMALCRRCHRRHDCGPA